MMIKKKLYHMTSLLFSGKNRMTTRVITLWCVRVTSLTTSMSAVRFLIAKMLSLNATNPHFKGSSDKEDLTRVVISYEIYENCLRLVP